MALVIGAQLNLMLVRVVKKNSARIVTKTNKRERKERTQKW